MLELDLHGIRHIDVDRIVENFIFLNALPLYIITGNSMKMLEITMEVLGRNNFEYVIGNEWNKGYIKVLK